MRKFIRFTAQYYMDEHPFDTIQVMDPERAQDYINYMNIVWSGGHFYPEYHVLDEIEALKQAMLVIEEEQAAQLDDSEERINNILSDLKECYGIDYKPNN